MTKKGGKILLWILSWAILALVIVYSPIGSPDLYTGNKYIVYSQGVNFSGGIANAPKTHNYSEQYDTPDLGIPVYTPEPKSYAVNSFAGTSKINNGTNYSVSTPATTGRTGGTATNGAGGVSGIATFGFSRSTQSNTTTQNNGVGSISMTSDLTTVQDPTVTTRQGASAGALDGGTDPGGDPTGPPIPVGDGYWLLMLMAVGYAYWKRKHLLHKV
ncbi:MAG: hypothetical protein PHS84_09465 [Paludibacter sp.]|nr:hypothetical protein [Paludibacter sp.]